MFRLIKLALWGLVGYALYELYLGVREGGQGQPSGGAGAGGAGGRMGEEAPARGMNMTGGGSGMKTRTEEPSGTSSRHNVGRGVIS